MKNDMFQIKRGSFAPEQNRIYLYGKLFPKELYKDSMVDTLIFGGFEEDAIKILKRIVRSLTHYNTRYTVGLFDGKHITYCNSGLFALGDMNTALFAYKEMKKKADETKFVVQTGFVNEGKCEKHTQSVSKKLVFVRIEGSPKLRQDFWVVGNVK